MKDSFYKMLGCVLIATGTAVGAGMLAIPLVTAAVGFKDTAVLLFCCWAVMIFTALLILEVNLAFSENSSFSSMSLQTLGRMGQFVTWLSFLLLLYALDAAYITGGSSLLSHFIYLVSGRNIPSWINTLLFTIALGVFIVWGTHAVDYLNRFLISFKAIALIVLLIVLMPHIKLSLLLSQTHGIHTILLALPILITSFGFHIVIPSIRQYLGPDPKKLRRVILIGGTLPLIVYLIWDCGILGIIPLTGSSSFASLAEQQGSIGGMLSILESLLHRSMVSASANLFSDVAITTSFLGVSLSLYDFVIDGFKLNKVSLKGKTLATLLTFGLPVIFALFYPQGFILALNYASLFVVILLIILPILMTISLRRQNKAQAYRVKAGKPILWLGLALGAALLILEIIIAAGGIKS
ncbi:MAG: tyrosine-specific transport protein [Gammaproteobacteria bacterium]|jgi:tyrosine-specific transport protein|nr:tyrosine-specific transport protein [Gammaproteobacteria bacterium]